MAELEELLRAVNSLNKNIADFPVGAISINDLKPTEEKIQDLRQSLKGLNTRLLMLKAKTESRKLSGVSERSEQETHIALQEGIINLTINNKTVDTCLKNSGIMTILQSEDTEIHETLNTIMIKLYNQNDVLIALDQSRAIDMARETQLKWQLQTALSQFKDFLKEQESIRKKKLQETNPEIARQTESMQTKLQRINIMKRLITNFIGSSNDFVKYNPELKMMLENHRELLDLETVMKLAQKAKFKTA